MRFFIDKTQKYEDIETTQKYEDIGTSQKYEDIGTIPKCEDLGTTRKIRGYWNDTKCEDIRTNDTKMRVHRKDTKCEHIDNARQKKEVFGAFFGAFCPWFRYPATYLMFSISVPRPPLVRTLVIWP